MRDDKLVVVYRPKDSMEAHAIEEALQEAGIPCYIDGEHAANIWGGLGQAGILDFRSKIIVRQADEVRARRLIDEGDWPSYTGSGRHEQQDPDAGEHEDDE